MRNKKSGGAKGGTINMALNANKCNSESNFVASRIIGILFNFGLYESQFR